MSNDQLTALTSKINRSDAYIYLPTSSRYKRTHRHGVVSKYMPRVTEDGRGFISLSEHSSWSGWFFHTSCRECKHGGRRRAPFDRWNLHVKALLARILATTDFFRPEDLLFCYGMVRGAPTICTIIIYYIHIILYILPYIFLGAPHKRYPYTLLKHCLQEKHQTSLILG